MRKFGRAFLTTAAIILLLINLVVIIMYGRQFYACVDSSGTTTGGFCSPEADISIPSVFLLNIVVILVFVLVWLAIRSYRHRFPVV